MLELFWQISGGCIDFQPLKKFQCWCLWCIYKKWFPFQKKKNTMNYLLFFCELQSEVSPRLSLSLRSGDLSQILANLPVCISHNLRSNHRPWLNVPFTVLQKSSPPQQIKSNWIHPGWFPTTRAEESFRSTPKPLIILRAEENGRALRGFNDQWTDKPAGEGFTQLSQICHKSIT